MNASRDPRLDGLRRRGNRWMAVSGFLALVIMLAVLAQLTGII